MPRLSTETVRRMYWEDGLSQREIGEKLGCSRSLVGRFMRRNGIPRRSPSAAISLGWDGDVFYYKKTDGREVICSPDGNHFLHHRLLAIAHHGFNAVKDKHVHHKNGVPWDNRPDNLQLVNPAEHIRIHQERGDIEPPTGEDSSAAKLTEEQVREIRERYETEDITHRELAAEYGMTKSPIGRILRHETWKGV